MSDLPERPKLTRNAIRCLACGDIIECYRKGDETRGAVADVLETCALDVEEMHHDTVSDRLPYALSDHEAEIKVREQSAGTNTCEVIEVLTHNIEKWRDNVKNLTQRLRQIHDLALHGTNAASDLQAIVELSKELGDE